MQRNVKVGDFVTGAGFHRLACKVTEIKRSDRNPDVIYSIGVVVVEYQPHPNGYEYGQTPGAFHVGEIRWFTPTGIRLMPNYGLLVEAQEWLATARVCKGKIRAMCENYANDARLKLSRAIGGAYRTV